ncbi:MAG: Fic family protein [archaeon]
MAYIHVKRINGKKYYTLRISVRDGENVITKDLCSLGSDLFKIKIDDLEKKYHAEIRKSYDTIKKFLDTNYYYEKSKKKKLKKDEFFSHEQIIHIDSILTHFNVRYRKLDKQTQADFLGKFLINFAVNSTSIEGNTITLKEADRLINEDIIPKNRSLREVNDLTNTKKTIEFLNEIKPEITLELIEKIHDMLLENIDERKGYRNHSIKILGQPFKPSPSQYVKADMRLLLNWLKKKRGKIHPLALATFFHHKFGNVHPFSDGNGRTGRVLMNYIMSSLDFPTFVINRRFRKEYLDSMNKADKSLKKGLIKIEIGDYRQLMDFMYSQFKISYWDNFLV